MEEFHKDYRIEIDDEAVQRETYDNVFVNRNHHIDGLEDYDLVMHTVGGMKIIIPIPLMSIGMISVVDGMGIIKMNSDDIVANIGSLCANIVAAYNKMGVNIASYELNVSTPTKRY